MERVLQTLNLIAIAVILIAILVVCVMKLIDFVRAYDDKQSLFKLMSGWILKKINPTPIKIKLLAGGQMPEQKHEGDAGYDCYARLSEPVTIKPGTVTVIPLGFCMELPNNWYADVRPRSGLAAKEHVVAQLGLIDEPYRNELGGIISNFSKKPFVVNNGDRICQIQCHESDHYKFVKVENLSTTDRGEGFGSSGV